MGLYKYVLEALYYYFYLNIVLTDLKKEIFNIKYVSYEEEKDASSSYRFNRFFG